MKKCIQKSPGVMEIAGMNLENHRISFQKKDGRTFLLIEGSTSVFELNVTSELIFRDLLKGLSPSQIARHLKETFRDIGLSQALSETRNFFRHFAKRYPELQTGNRSSIPFPPPLTKVTLGITNRCNLKCCHCLAGTTLNEKKEFSFRKLTALSSELSDLGCLSVSVFGGEPLLRSDFWEIIRLLDRKGIQIKVNTNGTLISPEFAKKARDENIHLFTVSLDGASPGVQDPFRGKGSFKKNLSGIENLVSYGNRVILSTTLTRFNYKDIPNIASLAKRLGVLKARFNDVHYGGNAACFAESVRLLPKQKFQVLSRIKKARETYGDFIIGSAVDQKNLVEAASASFSPAFPLLIPPCGAAMGSLCIRPDGNVTPCEILWDLLCGNVWKKSIGEIYRNSKTMRAFRKPLLLNQEDISDCRDCRYLSICYRGHRCAPYFFPGTSLRNRARLGCWIR